MATLDLSAAAAFTSLFFFSCLNKLLEQVRINKNMHAASISLQIIFYQDIENLTAFSENKLRVG
jgi:hypothetical protein